MATLWVIEGTVYCFTGLQKLRVRRENKLKWQEETKHLESIIIVSQSFKSKGIYSHCLEIQFTETSV